ncbi:RecB-like helicase [Hydrogenimonas sp.]
MERLYALSASAGSGKTFALVARYLALLFTGAKPSEILAITFTNKAAGEMRERLVASLEALPPDMAAEVARMSGLSVDAIEKKRPEALEAFLRSDLKVMTIDKFIHQVLRKFCWYAGIESDFTIAATPKEAFFESYLRSLDDKRWRDLVDFARFEAKKRRDIADFFEILYEKEKELPPLPKEAEPYDESEVMRWALEIKDFILHSDASDAAKKAVDYEDLEGLLARAKSWLVKESLAEYRYFKKVHTPRLDEWFVNLKAALADYYARKERYFLSRIYTLYDLYKTQKLARMRKSGQLYFKDIEHLVYELLRQKDFTDFLYFRLDARIGHILFDEFQDTSVTQYRIFEPIIAEIASAESGRTFFYVGDTKQSIYRFRGGQKALFDYVAKRFGVTVGHLATNYRSKEAIVEFVNRTFPYVRPPQKAAKKGGYVEVAEGEPLELLEATLSRLLAEGVDEREIAVLVHDNKEILRVGELIGEKFGRPIATHKRAKVAEQPSAKALIELMRLAYTETKGADGSLHRLNFLALTGRPYDAAFRSGLKRTRPAKMLKAAMDRWGLFDEAAMKLLEFAIPLHDLVEFVHEVAEYDEELPPKEVAGVNVLTIHKSKGLEFEHLIVLDRLGQGARDDAPVIFDYEGIELRALRMKFRHREAVDADYAAALEREKRLAGEDAMNRAYVAFTRAKSSLFVLKKEKKSAFEFLHLQAGSVGELEVARAEKADEKRLEPLRLKGLDYGRQEVTHDPERYEANDFGAIYLGQGVHYLFETEDFDAFLNRYGALCDPEKAKALYEAGRSNIAYLFLTEGEAIHELPYVWEGREGVVDLFVDKGEEGVIVDFKTATPHDIEAYRQQLRRYKEALTALMRGKRIEAYLYFLDTLELQQVE